MTTSDGQTTQSHRAASYAPDEYDSDGSLHTVDDDANSDVSSYEDCIDDARDETTDRRTTASDRGLVDPYIGSRRRFVDIGDDDVTFRDRDGARPHVQDVYVTDSEGETRGRRIAPTNQPGRATERDPSTTAVRRRVRAASDGQNKPFNHRRAAPGDDRPCPNEEHEVFEEKRGVTRAGNPACKSERRAQNYENNHYDDAGYLHCSRDESPMWHRDVRDRYRETDYQGVSHYSGRAGKRLSLIHI